MLEILTDVAFDHAAVMADVARFDAVALKVTSQPPTLRAGTKAFRACSVWHLDLKRYGQNLCRKPVRSPLVKDGQGFLDDVQPHTPSVVGR